MTKTKGVPLPDPKKWKKCKHKGCDDYAIFLEDYCWRHLPDKAKSKYKAKIEKWVKAGHSLEAANLQDAILQEAYLKYADCRRANLRWANLQKAYLSMVKLQGAFLTGVLWNEAQYFSLQNLGRIKRVGEEINKDWRYAQDAYRRLKNYFHQQGRYGDESEAYYREKLMAKHWAYEQCFKWKQSKNFFSWFGLWLLWAVAGFGERWMRIIPWVAGILAFFTGLFFLGSNLGWGAPYDHPTLLSIGNLFDCFVFSVVTFVTLGFGAIWTSAWLAKALIILEAGLGFVFLGMFVVLIARKFGR